MKEREEQRAYYDPCQACDPLGCGGCEGHVVPREGEPTGEEPVDVLFRVWRRRGSDVGGGVVALFPELDEGRGRCASYAHLGGHAAADYAGVVAASRPARPEEFAALKAELEAEPYGYRLRVRQRRASWSRRRGR